MIFEPDKFTTTEQITLLERSILVNSVAYYEYDDNILSDRQYDMNTRQLMELMQAEPEAFKKSKYARYFDTFESGTGYDLPGRIRKNKKLYNKIARDACTALRLKRRGNENG